MTNTVKINKHVDEKLTLLSQKRKSEGSPIKTKVAILHELIFKAYDKECKNG